MGENGAEVTACDTHVSMPQTVSDDSPQKQPLMAQVSRTPQPLHLSGIFIFRIRITRGDWKSKANQQLYKKNALRG